MFRTVLVANRGEIACRVIRSLRELGIRSVAVYSDADADARHVREADAAVRLGPASAAESYLSIERVIEAARSTGAEAIHPGYGFLAENADFAHACEEAGIVFIGPGLDALTVMGDKIRSKEHVAAAGVPILPGASSRETSEEAFEQGALAVGLPLIVKPSAGGGGKGMQIVRTEAELPGALAAARRVAASAFGDDTLLVERLVEAPRHIEVQVLADTHGNIIHLGERECSLQRRHQKVIEEAPSPLLTPAQRERMGEAACAVARSVDYVGAGTVEFLVSDHDPDEFFFMEMNTRLQVEHPVTEEVTGVDLVAWQVRIAAGAVLDIAQSEVALTGHSIEARVYAEDPARGFLPSAGTVLALREPRRVRVDSALLAGLAVSPDYDPMLAKVIALGDTREEALRGLDEALGGFTVLGLRTNVEYLRMLLADPDVQAGRLDTGLIARRLPELVFAEPDEDALAVAAAQFVPELPALAGTAWSASAGWRISGTSSTPVTLESDAGRHTVELPAEAGAVAAGVAGAAGASGRLTASGWLTARDGDTVWLGRDGVVFPIARISREQLTREAVAAAARAGRPASPELVSPMPGTVVLVAVEDGALVAEGELIATVEAMKMEHRLLAPIAGTVRLGVSPGQHVPQGHIVATIESGADADAGEPATPEPSPTTTKPGQPPATDEKEQS